MAPSCENDEGQEDADEIMVELDAETLPPQESDSDGMFVHTLGTCIGQQNVFTKTHFTLRSQ